MINYGTNRKWVHLLEPIFYHFLTKGQTIAQKTPFVYTVKDYLKQEYPSNLGPWAMTMGLFINPLNGQVGYLRPNTTLNKHGYLYVFSDSLASNFPIMGLRNFVETYLFDSDILYEHLKLEGYDGLPCI